jgi:hypothetical protein
MYARPSDIDNPQDLFGDREVGLTHPDNDSFIKLADNGDIRIMANNNLGLIISPSQNCIFLIADAVKFLTKEDEGLRWNNLAFNHQAIKFSEPAFIYPKKQTSSIYDGISHFLDES